MFKSLNVKENNYLLFILFYILILIFFLINEPKRRKFKRVFGKVLVLHIHQLRE